jgi:hypothetical protein
MVIRGCRKSFEGNHSLNGQGMPLDRLNILLIYQVFSNTLPCYAMSIGIRIDHVRFSRLRFNPTWFMLFIEE